MSYTQTAYEPPQYCSGQGNVMEFVDIKQNLLEDGKIVRWPKKTADKNAVLGYIAVKIPVDEKFSEAEMNEIIMKNIIFDDYVLIRRELIEKGYLNRTKDCREYWRIM
ncbi:MAG: DUF2087 domain-containing protein [Treponema sp.]|jgi:hypothetical protein|nr:DUF2087 domain-containing protein [Treponema sp.]